MIRTLDLQDWIAFDSEHPAPTFFARPAWARALADAFPALVPAPLRVGIDGITYLVPTMQSRHVRLNFREHLAFPLGGYSCVLDERGGLADDATAHAVLQSLARHVDHLRIIPWPLGPAITVRGARQRVYETAVIDCSNGFDAVLGNVRGVTRRMAGQAQRRGVVCDRADESVLPAYFDILREASIGWGLPRPPVSYELLEAVLRHGGDDAQLWLSRLDGEAIGGGVILFGSQELFFWSAAMRREFGRYRPSNALNLALIGEACARGVRWYNLGASQGLEGVARFKEDLGATSIPYVELSLRRPAFHVYETVRSAIHSRQRSA